MSHKLSRSSMMELTDYDLNTIDVVELKRRVDQLEHEMAVIDLENELFERYLDKNDPELLVGIKKQLAKQKAAPRIQFALSSNKSHETMHSAVSGFSGRTSRSLQLDAASIVTSTSFNRSIRTMDSQRQDACVSFAMRAELAAKEAATMRHNANRIQAEAKIKCRDLIAEMEELRLTNDELNETRREFREFVLEKGVNPMTMKIPSERLMKFFDSWTKNGNALVAKMRLQTSTMKLSQRNKQMELAVKAELSGILRPVDFQELEIETTELQQQFRDKTVYLKALKRTTGNASLALATQRYHLHGKESLLRHNRAEMKRLSKMQHKYQVDIDIAEQEISRWNKRNEKLNTDMVTHEAPSINDYMQRKEEQSDLDRQVKTLERSVGILSIKLKNARKKQRLLMNKHDRK